MRFWCSAALVGAFAEPLYDVSNDALLLLHRGHVHAFHRRSSIPTTDLDA